MNTGQREEEQAEEEMWTTEEMNKGKEKSTNYQRASEHMLQDIRSENEGGGRGGSEGVPSFLPGPSFPSLRILSSLLKKGYGNEEKKKEENEKEKEEHNTIYHDHLCHPHSRRNTKEGKIETGAPPPPPPPLHLGPYHSPPAAPTNTTAMTEKGVAETRAHTSSGSTASCRNRVTSAMNIISIMAPTATTSPTMMTTSNSSRNMLDFLIHCYSREEEEKVGGGNGGGGEEEKKERQGREEEGKGGEKEKKTLPLPPPLPSSSCSASPIPADAALPTLMRLSHLLFSEAPSTSLFKVPSPSSSGVNLPPTSQLPGRLDSPTTSAVPPPAPSDPRTERTTKEEKTNAEVEENMVEEKTKFVDEKNEKDERKTLVKEEEEKGEAQVVMVVVEKEEKKEGGEDDDLDLSSPVIILRPSHEEKGTSKGRRRERGSQEGGEEAAILVYESTGPVGHFKGLSGSPKEPSPKEAEGGEEGNKHKDESPIKNSPSSPPPPPNACFPPSSPIPRGGGTSTFPPPPPPLRPPSSASSRFGLSGRNSSPRGRIGSRCSSSSSGRCRQRQGSAGRGRGVLSSSNRSERGVGVSGRRSKTRAFHAVRSSPRSTRSSREPPLSYSSSTSSSLNPLPPHHHSTTTTSSTTTFTSPPSSSFLLSSAAVSSTSFCEGHTTPRRGGGGGMSGRLAPSRAGGGVGTMVSSSSGRLRSSSSVEAALLKLREESEMAARRKDQELEDAAAAAGVGGGGRGQSSTSTASFSNVHFHRTNNPGTEGSGTRRRKSGSNSSSSSTHNRTSPVYTSGCLFAPPSEIAAWKQKVQKIEEREGDGEREGEEEEEEVVVVTEEEENQNENFPTTPLQSVEEKNRSTGRRTRAHPLQENNSSKESVEGVHVDSSASLPFSSPPSRPPLRPAFTPTRRRIPSTANVTTTTTTTTHNITSSSNYSSTGTMTPQQTSLEMGTSSLGHLPRAPASPPSRPSSPSSSWNSILQKKRKPSTPESRGGGILVQLHPFMQSSIREKRGSRMNPNTNNDKEKIEKGKEKNKKSGANEHKATPLTEGGTGLVSGNGGGRGVRDRAPTTTTATTTTMLILSPSPSRSSLSSFSERFANIVGKRKRSLASTDENKTPTEIITPMEAMEGEVQHQLHSSHALASSHHAEAGSPPLNASTTPGTAGTPAATVATLRRNGLPPHGGSFPSRQSIREILLEQVLAGARGLHRMKYSQHHPHLEKQLQQLQYAPPPSRITPTESGAGSTSATTRRYPVEERIRISGGSGNSRGGERGTEELRLFKDTREKNDGMETTSPMNRKDQLKSENRGPRISGMPSTAYMMLMEEEKAEEEAWRRSMGRGKAEKVSPMVKRKWSGGVGRGDYPEGNELLMANMASPCHMDVVGKGLGQPTNRNGRKDPHEGEPEGEGDGYDGTANRIKPSSSLAAPHGQERKRQHHLQPPAPSSHLRDGRMGEQEEGEEQVEIEKDLCSSSAAAYDSRRPYSLRPPFLHAGPAPVASLRSSSSSSSFALVSPTPSLPTRAVSPPPPPPAGAAAAVLSRSVSPTYSSSSSPSPSRIPSGRTPSSSSPNSKRAVMPLTLGKGQAGEHPQFTTPSPSPFQHPFYGLGQGSSGREVPCVESGSTTTSSLLAHHHRHRPPSPSQHLPGVLTEVVGVPEVFSSPSSTSVSLPPRDNRTSGAPPSPQQFLPLGAAVSVLQGNKKGALFAMNRRVGAEGGGGSTDATATNPPTSSLSHPYAHVLGSWTKSAVRKGAPPSSSSVPITTPRPLSASWRINLAPHHRPTPSPSEEEEQNKQQEEEEEGRMRKTGGENWAQAWCLVGERINKSPVK